MYPVEKATRAAGGFAGMAGLHRNTVFDAVEDISRQTAVEQVATVFARSMGRFGFTFLGINGLPPPGEGADLVVVTESAPEGFRDCYIAERFYLVDHLCTYARTVSEPFRFSDAPYDRTQTPAHERFLQALETYGMRHGIVVPIGRPTNMPACVWVSGKEPDLDSDTVLATQVIGLFAASKARALAAPPESAPRVSTLSARERDVLQWISAGKTSWEIGSIAGLSERAVNKIVAEAMIKMEAVTRTQAVVNALRLGEIEL